METLRDGYRGLGLVMLLNWDRAVFLTTIMVALLLGAWLGGL